MTLDVRVMRILDLFATMNEDDSVKDDLALTYINHQVVPRERPDVRSGMVKYYFKAKQHYNEDKAKQAFSSEGLVE